MKNQILKTNVRIVCGTSIVGRKEKEGPIGECFDICDTTDKFNQKTWEKAEMEMQKRALSLALEKSHTKESDIDVMFAGDLLNQCIGSAYGLLDFDIPFFGLYGACSTAVEGLMLSSLLISGGHFKRCASDASSHFCSW